MFLPKIRLMGLVQKQRTAVRAVVDSRIMRLGANLSHELIDSIRARNDSVWYDKKSWIVGFYFGTGDDRLWVPKRDEGEQHPEKRIINFAHPKGKQAAQILMLAYLISTIGAVLVTAFILGYS